MISFVFNNEVIFFKSMKLFENEKFSIKKFKTKIVKIFHFLNLKTD